MCRCNPHRSLGLYTKVTRVEAARCTCSMDSRHVSFYLVTVLSLQGVDTLRMANGLVPEELTDGRIGIMSRIVKQHCNLTDSTEEECQVAHKISMQKLGVYFRTNWGSSDTAYDLTFRKLQEVRPTRECIHAYYAAVEYWFNLVL